MTEQNMQVEEDVCKRFNINPQDLNKFSFREQRSDIQSSVILLGQRILRQYMSEFILPDNTRIGVRRQESSQPVDQTQVVVVSLCVGHPYDSLLPIYQKSGADDALSDTCSIKTLETSEEVMDTEDEIDLQKLTQQSNLRIGDYLDDDVWAAAILECDSSTNGELLRQMEDGCKLDPDAFRMERLQRRRNWKTVVNIQQEPQTRNLGFSSTTDEADSTFTGTPSLD